MRVLDGDRARPSPTRRLLRPREHRDRAAAPSLPRRIAGWICRSSACCAPPPCRPRRAVRASEALLGPEVGGARRALRRGDAGDDRQRSLTLYSAVPVRSAGAGHGRRPRVAVHRPAAAGPARVRGGILARLPRFAAGRARAQPVERRDAGAAAAPPATRSRGAARAPRPPAARRIGARRRDRRPRPGARRARRAPDQQLPFASTVAADVSHEFKNPLASIRGAAEMLAEVDDPAERRRFFAPAAGRDRPPREAARRRARRRPHRPAHRRGSTRAARRRGAPRRPRRGLRSARARPRRAARAADGVPLPVLASSGPAGAGLREPPRQRAQPLPRGRR